MHLLTTTTSRWKITISPNKPSQSLKHSNYLNSFDPPQYLVHPILCCATASLSQLPASSLYTPRTTTLYKHIHNPTFEKLQNSHSCNSYTFRFTPFLCFFFFTALPILILFCFAFPFFHTPHNFQPSILVRATGSITGVQFLHNSPRRIPKVCLYNFFFIFFFFYFLIPNYPLPLSLPSTLFLALPRLLPGLTILHNQRKINPKTNQNFQISLCTLRHYPRLPAG